MPFIPLDATAAPRSANPRRGFVPLEEIEATQTAAAPVQDQPAKTPVSAQAPAERPSIMRNVTPKPITGRDLALNNPATAIGETALNLISQGIAMPVAGLAGLATEGARAVGLTDKTGTDVIHGITEAGTYQPRGELGQALTGVVMYPFEKLAEGGQYLGNKTLDATGSPVAATIVDTAVNSLPMAIGPGVKGAKKLKRKLSKDAPTETTANAKAPATTAEGQPQGFTPLGDRITPESVPYFPDPHEIGVKSFTERAKKLGLADEQIKELAPAEPRDAVTGFFRTENRVPTVKRAQEFAEANDVPTWYVEADIANLGGLNDHFGNNHSLSNKVYRDLADIFAQEMDKAGARSIPIRQGGDEINAVIIGGTPEAVRTAIATVNDRVQAYAEANGLATIPHPKGKAPGIGLYSGYSEIKPGRPLQEIFDEAAHSLDQGKKERKNVGRKPDEAIDGVVPDQRSGRGTPQGRGIAGDEGTARGAINGRDGSQAGGPLATGEPGQVTPTPLSIPEGGANAAQARAQRLASDDPALSRTQAQGFSPLRSEGDSSLPAVADEFRSVSGRPGAGAESQALAGAPGRDAGLRAGELHLDDAARAGAAPRVLPEGEFERSAPDHRGGFAGAGDAGFPAAAPSGGVRAHADGVREAGAFGPEERTTAGVAGGNSANRAIGEAGRDGSPVALEPTESRLAARSGAESGTPTGPAPGRIFGRSADTYPDAELIRLRSTLKSESLRADIDAEIARRQGAAAINANLPETGTVQGRLNSFAPGANYVGFIDDTPRPGAPSTGTSNPASAPKAATARTEPIRREDILIPFMKALNAGIYEGRVKGKGVMGFFRPKLEEVRTKRHADLETAAHELAHLIDYRIPEIRKSWHSGKNWQIHRDELRDLSYDSTKIYEGFAEFVRHYMTQPDVARTRAPTFHAWFDDFVSRHEYGPAIRKAQEGMTGWFNQSAIDRARSKIGDHRPLSDALDGRWDAFRQATVDDLHGVYRMERELTGGKLAPNGPYESARLSRASASMADGALRFGAPVKKPDGSFAWKGKGLEEILKPVAENLDDALLYFVGRSARELMAQGREHLFTAGEIDAMLKLKRPEFDKAFQEYQAWNKAVLDFAEAQGVINPEARALWQRTNYMPFHRVAQPDGFKGKPGDWSGIKALTGGTENLRDILGNMTANAAMLIDKAVKNEARQKIANLAETNQGGGKFMVKIPAEARPIKINKDAVIDALLDSMGISKSNPAAAKVEKKLRKLFEDAPAMLDLMQQNMPPAGGNVVAVLKGGKPTWYEVGDPLLLRALEAIDRPLPTWIVKWLGLPKRVGQATITLTPDFMIANMARDTIMGSVMSRAGFRPIIDSMQGMRMRLANDPLYKEFIANGGGLSSIFLDESKFRAKIEKFYNKQGIDYRTVLDAPDKLLGFIETLGDAFEMSTRLGEYRRAIQRGENPRHAAYLGREVSTDFAMRGDSKALGFLYDTVMFLRPAVVSWDRLARGLAHDPNKGAIASKAGMLALMSAGLYLLNKDDPRYQDLPDWDRDSHWHFFIGDQHFRYPKIWEIGALSSAAERTTEKIIEADPQGLGKDFARILGATFNLNLMPQILAPLYEQGTNRNKFTDSPIETPGMENVQPFMRAKPTTSETMKAAGMATRNLPESLQVNPVRAEALLRGYFNTWAMYGLMASDGAFFADKAPERRTDQLPVIRRFYQQDPPLNTKWETQFYDLLGEARRLHGTLRELDKIGRSEIADEKEREPLAPEAKPLERASQNLQKINQEMRKVRRDDALSPAEKREQLDALTVERNDLLKRAVQDTKKSQKEKGQ